MQPLIKDDLIEGVEPPEGVQNLWAPVIHFIFEMIIIDDFFLEVGPFFRIRVT